MEMFIIIFYVLDPLFIVRIKWDIKTQQETEDQTNARSQQNWLFFEKKSS